MLAQVIHERVAAPEFHPFTLVLVNGDRLTVRHRDSLAHPFALVNGKRSYSPYIVVVQATDDGVETRSVSLPMIAQVIDEHGTNGKA